MNDETFPFDVAAEKAVARLRLFGGLAVLACVAFLGSAAGSVGVVLLVVFALIALAWIAFASATLRRVEEKAGWKLALTEGHVTIEDRESSVIPYAEIHDIDVDDEKLELVISGSFGTRRVKPIFAGVALPELAEKLRERVRA